MRIVCISDTHSYTPIHLIPNGDVLVCSGDFTRNGSDKDIILFARWYNSLPHKYKIVIAGNHDRSFENASCHAKNKLLNTPNNSIIYLQDTEIVIDDIKFYGTPWQPAFNNWAFNLPRDSGFLANKWMQIPSDTDVLITHGPIFGILDKCNNGYNAGCSELRYELFNRVQPLLHIFGHIHEGYGYTEFNNISFVNASICNANYMPINRPIVIDIIGKIVNYIDNI